jgi:lipopolysaccharide assembly outer membrane protein LptD (OstA)
VRLLPTLSLLPISLVPAFGQTGHIDLAADKLIPEAAVLRGLGHARAKIGDLVLHADEATLRSETGELELRGHVHVILPAREDHSVFRYGTAVLLTDQPVGLTADRLTVKKGLLQASGNIVLVPVDPELPKVQLQGDEISMDLKTADATLRGNPRALNLPEPITVPRRFVFPPEIIK